jgi:hypothetical protein
MNNKINTGLITHGPISSAKKPAYRFNWRGNRPRMGKRGMCPLCGFIHAGPGGFLCIECGERVTVDVSYDDPPQKPA